MPITPEDRARQKIDQLLSAAGWIVQDRNAANITAGRGVAVREFPMKKGHGEADYLLFLDGAAAGVIEAKRAGETLTGVEIQTQKYSEGIPNDVPCPRRPLPFLYQSTGVETRFTSLLDPDARSRPVFAFHRPETLAEWLDDELKHPGSTVRARLRHMPPVAEGGLRPAQIQAIKNLEVSLADQRPRALIQMASGGGKTYTACNISYRLIKYAGANRVLFLVDRSNLGRQTLKEFQAFITPDENRPFTELYNVQHMQSNKLDDVGKVCITTIQRLYSMLRGEEQLDPALEEQSAFTMADLQAGPVPVEYNPKLPIETFDFIITDECHRSIYNLWRQVLEYFDASLIGLTATPSKQTIGFFKQNLVMDAADDILVSITADVGMVALVPEGLGEAFINQHVALCRPVSCFQPKYLAWFLASESAQRQLRELQRGATKVGLGLDDIRAVVVPMPPSPEQNRIVSAVEQVLSICDGIGAEVDRLFVRAGRLRQSILKRAFEGKLVPQDPNDEPASVLLERIRAERADGDASRTPSRKRESGRAIAAREGRHEKAIAQE